MATQLEEIMRRVQAEVLQRGPEWLERQLWGSPSASVAPAAPVATRASARRSRAPERLSPEPVPRARRRWESPAGAPPASPARSAASVGSGEAGRTSRRSRGAGRQRQSPPASFPRQSRRRSPDHVGRGRGAGPSTAARGRTPGVSEASSAAACQGQSGAPGPAHSAAAPGVSGEAGQHVGVDGRSAPTSSEAGDCRRRAGGSGGPSSVSAEAPAGGGGRRHDHFSHADLVRGGLVSGPDHCTSEEEEGEIVEVQESPARGAAGEVRRCSAGGGGWPCPLWLLTMLCAEERPWPVGPWVSHRLEECRHQGWSVQDRRELQPLGSPPQRGWVSVPPAPGVMWWGRACMICCGR